MNSTITNRWTTAAGYEAVVIERPMGPDDQPFLDGYVLLPETHPWRDLGYSSPLGQGRLMFVRGVATYDDGIWLIDGYEEWDIPTPGRILDITPPVSFSGHVVGMKPGESGYGLTMIEEYWDRGRDSAALLDHAHLTTQLESLAAQLKLVEECNTLSDLIAKLEARHDNRP